MGFSCVPPAERGVGPFLYDRIASRTNVRLAPPPNLRKAFIMDAFAIFCWVLVVMTFVAAAVMFVASVTHRPGLRRPSTPRGRYRYEGD